MNDKIHDPLVIAGREFKSRLIVGTSRYPDPHVMLDALAASGTELVTVSVRRVNLADGSQEKQKKVDQAVDAINKKFGKSVVNRKLT